MRLQPGSYDPRRIGKIQEKILAEARKSFRHTALTDFGYVNSNGLGSGSTQLYTKKRVGWFKTESELVGDLIFSESEDDFDIACTFSVIIAEYFTRRLHGAIRDLRAVVDFKGLDEKLGKNIIVGSETIEKN